MRNTQNISTIFHNPPVGILFQPSHTVHPQKKIFGRELKTQLPVADGRTDGSGAETPLTATTLRRPDRLAAAPMSRLEMQLADAAAVPDANHREKSHCRCWNCDYCCCRCCCRDCCCRCHGCCYYRDRRRPETRDPDGRESPQATTTQSG